MSYKTRAQKYTVKKLQQELLRYTVLLDDRYGDPEQIQDAALARKMRLEARANKGKATSRRAVLVEEVTRRMAESYERDGEYTTRIDLDALDRAVDRVIEMGISVLPGGKDDTPN